MSLIRKALDIDELIKRYLAGESEKQLSLSLKVNRGVIRRRLLENRIKPRGRSESMFVRMAQTSVDERRRLATAAHDAIRGVKRGPAELHRRALSRQRTLTQSTPTEVKIAAMLQRRGFEFVRQLAVGPYNIDIAISEPPITVEICGHNSKQMTKSPIAT